MNLFKRIKTIGLAAAMTLGVLLSSFAGITASATMNDEYYTARTSESKISVTAAADSGNSKYSKITNGNMGKEYQYLVKTTDNSIATVTVDGRKNNGQRSIDKGLYTTNTEFIHYWKLDDSWKGNITATYSHCGYYNGTEIDVKLTLMDWEFLDNNLSRNNTEDTSDDASNIYVSFPSKNYANTGQNRLGIEAFYCSWIKVKYSFVKSGTNIPVNVKGYTTFNDLDGCQGVHFCSSLDNICANGTGSKLSCNIVDGNLYIFDGEADTGTTSTDNEATNWVTATFSGTDMTVAFTFGLNSRVGGSIATNSVRGGAGSIVNYNQKAVRSEFCDPIKTVSDSNETDVRENTLANRTETFTYKISHYVPYESLYNWYRLYTISDQISQDLEILTQPQVYNENGENITESWDVEVTDRGSSNPKMVIASTNAQKENFYDHTYTLVIKVKIKDTVEINDGYSVSNTAGVTATGPLTYSNSVKTKVKNSSSYITKGFPEYSSISSFEGYTLYQGSKKEDVIYTGEIFAGNKNPYSSVEIKDTLEEGLTYKSMSIWTMNSLGKPDTDISSYGTNTSSGSSINYSFNSNHLTDIFNKKLIYFITVTVDNTQTGKATNDKIIPNTISLIVDGNTVNSNTPKIYIPGVNSPEKSVDKSEISEKTETVTYTISNFVNRKTKELYYYGGYKFTDKLEDVLQYKSAKVLNENGTNVSNLFTISEDNNTVTATAKIENLENADFYNHTYNLEIKASIIQNADLSSYMQDGDKAVIPNTGKLTVNGNDYPSNTVNFSYKSKSNNVDKYISAFNDGISESGLLNGNKVTYTGKAVIQDKTTVTSIILSDKLDSRLRYKSVSMSLNDDDINNWYDEYYDIQSNTVKFTFKSNKLSQLAGETIEYTLVCEYIGQYSENDTEIPNTMQLNVNDTPVESEESPKLHVSKVNNPVKSIDKSEISEKTETVTYTISNVVDSKTQEYFYNSYVITDTLENVLQYKSAKVLNEDGTDVSNLFTISEDNNTVTATAKNENLEKSNFYNHTYKLEIKASIIQNADLSGYMQGGDKAVIPNTAKLIANGKDYITDTVNFSYEPKADSVDKYIINKEGGKSAKAELFGDTVTYKGNAVIQDKTAVTSVELYDKLNSDLKYKNISISLDGTDITNWGTASYERDSNTVKYIFNSEKVSALAGKTIEYTLICDFIGELSKKSISIFNVINLKVNIDKKTSNEAILTTPVDPSITKYINESDESYSLHKNSEDITYTGNIIPGTHLKSKLSIKDDLADGLTYKSLKILSEDGKDITTYGKNSSSGSTVSFVFSDDKISEIYNTILRYELVVTAKKTYDGTATKNEETPNTIIMIVEDETVQSNTPKLYRSGVNSPTKSIDKSEISEKTETVTYTISNVVDSKTQEYFYNSYVITDTLENVLQYKSSKMLNEDGTDVSDLFTISVNGNTITATAKNSTVGSFYDHTYKLVIQASIADKNTDISSYCDKDGKATIPNTSTITVDGNVYPSNTVNFTYQPVSNSIEKLIVNVNGEKTNTAQLLKNTVSFAGNAVIQNKSSVTSVSISDKLDSYLKYKSMTVFFNNDDVTNWGKISYDEGSNTIVFTFNSDKAPSLAGEMVSYTITCDYTGNHSRDVEIPNTTTLSVNGEVTKSNTPIVYDSGVNIPEKSVAKSEISKKTDTITFIVSNVVSNKTQEYFYDSYVITDKLEDVLQYKSANVLDENNEDVSDLFTITEHNNTVTAIAKNTRTASFYGHTYKLTIKTGINQNTDLNDYYRNGKVVIPNTGVLTVNGNNYQSNSVEVSYETKTNNIDKYIVDSNGKKSEKVELYDTFATYSGDLVVQDKDTITSVVISDKLNSNLMYSKLSLNIGDNDITEWGNISYTEKDNTVTFTFKQDKLATVAGETISYTLICDYIGEPANKSIDIPNTIKMKVNEDTVTSNKTILTTPVDPSITKYINESDESYSLHKNSEDITYTGNIIPGTHLKSKLSIKDDLADGLTYKSLKILSEDGKDITTYGKNSSSGSTVSFVFSDDKISEIYNTILRYELVVTAKKTYDGTATKNEETPNTIIMIVEDETVQSNTPKLYRSGVNSPTKSIDKSEISEKTETVTYTISNVVDSKTQEYFYNSYVITDTLENVLQYKSSKMLNEDGTDVSDLFTISVNGNTITATAKNSTVGSFYDHTYKLVIQASIADKNTDISSYCDKDGKATIPNISTITVDGNVYPSNTVNFTYQTKSNSVDKYILDLNGEKATEAQLYDNVVTYTGNAVIKDSTEVTSIVLSDKLDGNLKYKVMKVSLDDKDITDLGNISYDKTSNTVSFSFNKDAFSSVVGETIEYALICDYVGKYSSESKNISNIIDMTVNEETEHSNDTDLKIPVDSYITKHIYNGDELVNEYTLSADRKDNKVYYEGSILISEKEPIDNIVFSDKLDSNLEFESISFLDGSTQLECNAEYKNGVVQAALSDNAIKNLEGKLIQWKMICNYVGEEKPTETVTIPNTANVNINNDNFSSNEVKAYVSMVSAYEATQKTTVAKDKKTIKNAKITGADNNKTDKNSIYSGNTQPNTGSKTSKAPMFLFAGLLLGIAVGFVYRFRKFKKVGKINKKR